MKNKWIATVLVGVLAVSMSGCASKEPSVDAEQLTMLQTQVQELQDKAEIKELVDSFSNLADQKDADTQALLFTEDGQVVISFNGQENVIEGREQIAEVFGGVVNGMDALYHMNGQLDVEVNGDTATGTAYCRVALVNTTDGVTTITDEAVIYNDEYVKQDDKWLISRRTSNFIFMDGHEMGGLDASNGNNAD